MLADPESTSHVETDDNESTRQEISIPPPAPAKEQVVEASLPDKYRGKSVQDVIAMHQNAESELGRSRNEIGTSRRVIDELLGLRNSNRAPEKSAQAAEPVTPHQLAENPEGTIVQVAKRVADERFADSGERLAALESRLQVEDLTRKHGNFRETLEQPDFQEWLRGSPYRIGLIQKAAAGDYTAGDEILSLYKEVRPKADTVVDKGDKLSEAKQQATAKSGGSGANKVVGGEGKKVYSRTELARLYIDNPTEYNRLSDSGELATAYSEKRVR